MYKIYPEKGPSTQPIQNRTFQEDPVNTKIEKKVCILYNRKYNYVEFK